MYTWHTWWRKPRTPLKKINIVPYKHGGSCVADTEELAWCYVQNKTFLMKFKIIDELAVSLSLSIFISLMQFFFICPRDFCFSLFFLLLLSSSKHSSFMFDAHSIHLFKLPLWQWNRSHFFFFFVIQQTQNCLHFLTVRKISLYSLYISWQHKLIINITF